MATENKLAVARGEGWGRVKQVKGMIRFILPVIK